MNDALLSQIRQAASDEFKASFSPNLRMKFDAVRKAMIVARVLDYLAVNVPEARQLAAEVSDLAERLKTAEEVTPLVRNWLA
jgi:uncharacterized membrane protein